MFLAAQALVDRPDEVRRMVNFKRMVLTDFKIDIPRLAKKKVLTAALEESGEGCSSTCVISRVTHVSGYACTAVLALRSVALYHLSKPYPAARFCAVEREKLHVGPYTHQRRVKG